jgi:hypothetical protein
MQINLFKFLKDNIIIFILINLIFLSSTFFFFKNINTGNKFQLSFKITLTDEIKKSFNKQVHDHIHYSSNFRGFFNNVISKNKYGELNSKILFKDDHLIFTYLTYDNKISKKNILNFTNKYVNKVVFLTNNELKKRNSHVIDTYEEHVKTLKNFDPSMLSLNERQKLLGEINLANNLDELLLFEKKNYDVFYGTFNLNNLLRYKIFVTSLSVLSDNINNNNNYPIYKIPEFNENDISISPIYINNFEYIFLLLMTFISIIGSFIFILILNYNNLYKYKY